MRALPLLLLLVLAAVGPGCGSSRIFDTDGDPRTDHRRKEIQAEIDALADTKDPTDVEKDLRADKARAALIARGSAIEPQLVEALGGHADWGVRLGVIEVLEAVGTRGCVEALITATGDPEALVALRANKLLEVMCDHREIPAPGEAVGANDLPPFASDAGDELALDARLARWRAWHAEHGAALRKAWSGWWATNRSTAKID